MVTRIRANLITASLCSVFIVTQLAQAQPLAGTYNIPSVPYPTIQAAVNALITNGISAPVTFSLAVGTYDDQITITSFTRTGAATDEVLFRPAGPGVVVNWTASSMAVSTNYIVKLQSVDYIRFRNINFDYDTGAGASARNKRDLP